MALNDINSESLESSLEEPTINSAVTTTGALGGGTSTEPPVTQQPIKIFTPKTLKMLGSIAGILLVLVGIAFFFVHSGKAGTQKYSGPAAAIANQVVAPTQGVSGKQLTQSGTLVVNSSLQVEGQLQVSAGGGDSVAIKPSVGSGSITLVLPAASGVLCLNNNNCNYATQAQLASGLATVAVPPSSLLNGINGLATLQGTSDEITVKTSANGVIALSLPQSISPLSSPTFAGLSLASSLEVGSTIHAAGAVTLSSLNCTTFAQGGKLTTDANGTLTCGNDASGVGSVTGSGAQNYVSKFNDASGTNLGDSTIYDDGNFVGIGTVTNNGLLSIQGSNAAQNGLSIQAATGQVADLLRLQDASNNVLSGFSANGSLYFRSGTYGSTVNTGVLSSNQTISLPDESGVVCLQSSLNCSFAPSTAGTGYIQNQSAAVQSANFSIQGTVGTVSAVVRGESGGVQNILNLTNAAGNTVGAVGASGAVTLTNSANSTAAFVVQNAAAVPILNVDTTNNLINLAAQTTVSGGTSQAQSSISNSGLVADYAFDEGSGTTVIDSSSFGTNGSVATGQSPAVGFPTYTTDAKVGAYALNFNGTQGVQVPNSVATNYTNNLTMETWVKFSGTSNNIYYDAIVTQRAKSGAVAGADAAYFWGRSNIALGDRMVFNYTSNGINTTSVTGNTTLQNDRWYHVAVTYDGSTIRQYINGALDMSVSASGTLWPSSQPVDIGFTHDIDATKPVTYLYGTLDNLKMFNTTLTPSDISSEYSQGAAPKSFVVTGGNVGIGTSSPTDALEVQGNDIAVNLQAKPITTDGALQNSPTLILGAAYDADATSGVTSAILNSTIQTVVTTGGSVPSSRLALSTGNGLDVMDILSSGNVGIGTIAPQQRLTVAGGNIAIETVGFTLGIVTPTPGGSLSAGVYYYKLAASDGSNLTAASNEISCTIDAVTNGSCAIIATMPINATSVRVYRGVSSNGENQFVSVPLQTTGATNLYVDDGSAVWTAGNPPTVNNSFAVKLSGNGVSSFMGGNVGVGSINPTSLLTVTGTQPVANIANGTAATKVLTVTGAKGGNTTGTTAQTAGAGAGASLTTGAGGDATGASGNNIAGSGGSVTITAAAGGNVTSATGTAGSGGSIILQGGAAGTGGAVAGTAGVVQLQGTSGLVGIGAYTNPGNGLEPLPTKFSVSETATAATGVQDAIRFLQTISPTSVSTARYAGVYNEAYVSNGNVGASTAVIAGWNLAQNGSTGTLGSEIGVKGEVNNFSSGSVTTAIGVEGHVKNLGTGNITNGYSLYAQVPIVTSTGTIPNYYGLYIQNPTGIAGVGSNNLYSIYSEGGNNYLGGNLGVGALIPAAKLQVATTSAVTGAILQGASGQTADLLDLQDFNGNTNAAFGPSGAVLTLGRIASSGAVAQGQLVFSDGSTDNFGVTLQSSLQGGNATISIPNLGGVNDTVCLQTLNNCAGGGGGGGGGSLTGAGTSNYVARWTSATNLSTGVLYDNGTSVGINATTFGTVNRLTVNPNNKVDNSATIQFNASAAANKVLVLQETTSQTADILESQGPNGGVLSGINASGGYFTNGTSTTLSNLSNPTFTTASTGATYFYRLTSTNAAGETTGSASLGMANNTSALAWTQVPGATGYKLYRNTSNSFAAGSLLLTTINSGSTTTFTDVGAATVAGLPPTTPTGTKLTVQAWASQGVNDVFQILNSGATVIDNFNGNGQLGVGTRNTSGKSLIVRTIATTDVGTIVQGVSGQTGDLLQMQNTNGPQLAGFTANGALYTNGTGNSLNGLATPAFTTASSGTNFYYELTATNAAGETVGSTALGMANNTSALAWTQVPGATGYKLYRNTSNTFSSGSLLLTTIANGATLTFTDVGAATAAGLPPTAPAGTTGLTIQGWASQTADLLSMKAADGTQMAHFTSNGSLFLPGSINLNASNLTSGFGSKLFVQPVNAVSVVAGFRGQVAQTADLLQLQNSSADVLTRADANGQLTLGTIGAVTGSSVAGSLAFGDGSTDGFTGTIKLVSVLAANQNYLLPTTGGTLCTTATCLTGSSAGFVQIGPSSAQTDSSNNSSIFINKTSATGNLIELQKNGTDQFAVNNTGQILLGASSGTTAKLNVATTAFVGATINENGTNDILDLQSSGTTKVAVNYEGKVAIGGTAPAAALDIVGTATAYTGTGTLTSVPLTYTISGTGTSFTTQLHPGDTITANGQTKTISAVIDDFTLSVTGTFSPALSGASFTYQQPSTRITTTSNQTNLELQASSGQTASLIEAQNSFGSSVFRVTAGGSVYAAGGLIAGSLGTFSNGGGGGNTNNLTVASGTTTNGGNTGVVTIRSGAASGANANSGDLDLNTGTASGSGNVTGDIVIDNGAASSGAVAGAISIGAANATGVSIGNAAGSFQLTSTAVNISMTGDITGTKSLSIGGGSFQVSNAGIVKYAAGAADTATAVCRNSSGQLASCTGGGFASGNGQAILQNGNGFGATMVVGTTDTQALNLITGNNAIATFSTTGQAIFKNSTNSTSAFQIQNSGGGALFTADTTNSRLYVGTVGGDSTGTILVVGNKTTAGDPAGVNGAIYYNASSNKFRCYQNSVWLDCISPSTNATKSADQTVSTTSYGDISNLGFSVGANHTYALQCSLVVSVTGSGGNLSTTGPAGASRYVATFLKTSDQSSGDAMTTSTSFDDPSVSSNFNIATTVTGSNLFIMDYRAVLANGNTAGTWQLRGKAAAASSSLSVYSGSSCSLNALN